MTTKRGIVVVLPLLLLLGAAYWYIGGHTLVYSQPAAEERAAELVEQGRSPEICWNIHTIVPTYPPVASFQATCIRKYAEITKDPKTCELLMPSRYGFSCIGGARTKNDPCTLLTNAIVRGKGVETTRNECFNETSSVANHVCCTMARISFTQEYNDCSLFEDGDLLDQCNYELSHKKRDPTFCNNILDENTKEACEVSAEVIRDNPSILD